MENTEKKLKYRILSLVLAFFLAFNPLVVPLALAVEEEPPAGEEEVQTEETTDPPADGESEPEVGAEGDQSGGDATITTGDAEATAEVETTANTHLDCLPGEVTTPDDPCATPEVESESPEGTEIIHDNLADVADETTASATTGDNQILGATGDALIDTGEATAAGLIENEINTNIVDFGGGGGEEDGGEEEIVEENLADIVIANENEVTLTNQADVLADTGENQTNKNGGSATIETGEALAYANVINFLNTNLVGSDFKVLLLDYLEAHQEDIDFNALWTDLMDQAGEGLVIESASFDSILIDNQNIAQLLNDVDVEAISGSNQANENQERATIETGDATALANVINFVNINLYGSKFLLAVVNVLGDFTGDLILPRPEKFTNDQDAEGTGVGEENLSATSFVNQNLAEIDDTLEAVADTGHNQANNNQGENQMTTGQAESQATSFVLTNTNISLNQWFLLIINPLGSWLGKIFGWSSPEAVEAPTGEPLIFQTGAEPNPGQEPDIGSSQIDLGLESTFSNENEAQVENDIQVTASTGQNQANENQGGSEIETGDARAVINLFDLINLNIIGGRWVLGIINILRNWTGNIIFAYPNLEVDLTNGLDRVAPGEEHEYTVTFSNQGHDLAQEAILQLELPEGLIFINDSSGLDPESSGQIYQWALGDLQPGEGGSFKTIIQVAPDFSPQEELSLLSRLIPVAHAAENEKEREVVVTAAIATSNPESDLNNNTASATTIVFFPAPPAAEEGGPDLGLPELEVSAWNNVNEFVYPGDTVTFEIIIKNTGPSPSYETYLSQELFNGLPEESFGKAGFEIGRLEAGQGAKLTFGVQLGDDGQLPAGAYYTLAQAFGKAPSGQEVISNQARTEFVIKWRQAESVFEARAVGKEEEVLGLVSECSQAQEDILPYILLMLLSGLWLFEFTQRKLKKESR